MGRGWTVSSSVKVFRIDLWRDSGRGVERFVEFVDGWNSWCNNEPFWIIRKQTGKQRIRDCTTKVRFFIQHWKLFYLFNLLMFKILLFERTRPRRRSKFWSEGFWLFSAPYSSIAVSLGSITGVDTLQSTINLSDTYLQNFPQPFSSIFYPYEFRYPL